MARFTELVLILEPFLDPQYQNWTGSNNLLAEDDSVQNQLTENFKFGLKIERTEE